MIESSKNDLVQKTIVQSLTCSKVLGVTVSFHGLQLSEWSLQNLSLKSLRGLTLSNIKVPIDLSKELGMKTALHNLNP